MNYSVVCLLLWLPFSVFCSFLLLLFAVRRSLFFVVPCSLLFHLCSLSSCIVPFFYRSLFLFVALRVWFFDLFLLFNVLYFPLHFLSPLSALRMQTLGYEKRRRLRPHVHDIQRHEGEPDGRGVRAPPAEWRRSVREMRPSLCSPPPCCCFCGI